MKNCDAPYLFFYRNGVWSGDTVVVWKLDRLRRLLKDLIETLNLLNNRGVDFISLTENIDTTTPGGKLIFHVMGALAEFERDLIRERTNAGLAAARARGRVGGRPRRADYQWESCPRPAAVCRPTSFHSRDLFDAWDLSLNIVPLRERGKEGIRSARIIIQKSPTESWDLHLTQEAMATEPIPGGKAMRLNHIKARPSCFLSGNDGALLLCGRHESILACAATR